LFPLKTALIVVLSILPAAGGGLFRSCVEKQDPKKAYSSPGLLATTTDRQWHRLTGILIGEAQQRRSAILKDVSREMDRLPDFPKLPTQDEQALGIQGSYGALPEVFVDIYPGVIFPTPIAPPYRVSWYQAALQAGKLIRTLKRFDRSLRRWTELPDEKKLEKFSEVETFFHLSNMELTTLTQHVRYLEAWGPKLENQKNSPSTLLAQAIQSDDPEVLNTLKEALKPQRVMPRSFLPEDLESVPGGIVQIPVITDISDRKFLKEVENALDMHWNQSSWAKKLGVSFLIRWSKLPVNPAFKEGRINLEEHVRRFPLNQAILTTGGLTTHVKDRAIILGPGKITPRTLAHEFGHILGFNDCYLRTLTSQGIFGLGILEWNNPFYPDDLMCDDNIGVPRAEVW